MLFACERPFRIRIQPLFVNAVEIRGCANGTDNSLTFGSDLD
jgi:hypothetical protein